MARARGWVLEGEAARGSRAGQVRPGSRARPPGVREAEEKWATICVCLELQTRVNISRSLGDLEDDLFQGNGSSSPTVRD